MADVVITDMEARLKSGYSEDVIRRGQAILDLYLVDDAPILETALEFMDFLKAEDISYEGDFHSDVFLCHNKSLG